METNIVTTNNFREAGIAASLAANVNILPPEISELSDQAEIFASNNTNVFKFTGGADADSDATNFGLGVATKAVERMIELEAERRKEDDPASDASLITEAGAAMRERLSAMRQVTVGGVTMTAEEWTLLRDGLNDPENQAQVSANMRKKGYSDDAIDAGRHWATVLSRAAEWQDQNPGQPLPPELQREVQEYERQSPEIKAATDEVRSQTIEIERGRSSEMTPTQTADLRAVEAANAGDSVQASEALAAQDFTGGETAELLARRSGNSVEFAFGDGREGPVISGNYNAAAEGQIEVAQNQELQLPPVRNDFRLDG